jgi:hypothetical protein
MAPLPNYLLYDADNRFICPVAEHDEAKVTWKLWETGTGTISIPGVPSSDILMAALSVHERPTLIEVQGVEGKRWTGRVHTGEYVDDGDGPNLELTLVNDRIWLDAMLAIVNPTGTASQQGTAEFDERTGPTETVVKAYIQSAILRLGLPMIVAPAPDVDPSPIVTLKARMTSMRELTDNVLKPAGFDLTVTMHRTGRPVPASINFEPPDGTLIVDVISGQSTGRLVWDEQQLATFSVSSTEGTAYRAYTGGDGQGIDRVFTEYVDEVAKARVGRYGLPEIYVDNDGTDSDEVPVAVPTPTTLDALAKAAGGLSVTFGVEDGRPWYAGEDWWLADFGAARIGGQLFDAQITEVTLNEDRDNGVVYAPTIGDSSPSRPEVIAEALFRLTSELRRRQARR